MSSYTKWIPFRLACRLSYLQRGSLNVGNARQNVANLLALCIANANGSRTFAKWGVLRAAGTSPLQYLRVYPVNVPGWSAPVVGDVFITDDSGLFILTDDSGANRLVQ